MARKVYEFHDAQHPDGARSETITVKLEPDLVQSIQRRAGAWLLHELRELVPVVLAKPELIFGGIRPDDRLHADFNERASYCYCARPDARWDNEGRRRPARPHTVYVVYVSDGWIFWWGELPAEANDRRLPVNHENRFSRGIIWNAG